MSQCDRCGNDDIYGRRSERRNHNSILWLCVRCRRALHALPALSPLTEKRDPGDWLPLVRIGSAALVLMSLILAIGAHW